MAQQARNASMAMADQGKGITHLLIDHDTKFTSGNMPLPGADEPGPRVLTFPIGEVKCREWPGGLLKHHRAAG